MSDPCKTYPRAIPPIYQFGSVNHKNLPVYQCIQLNEKLHTHIHLDIKPCMTLYYSRYGCYLFSDIYFQVALQVYAFNMHTYCIIIIIIITILYIYIYIDMYVYKYLYIYYRYTFLAYFHVLNTAIYKKHASTLKNVCKTPPQHATKTLR